MAYKLRCNSCNHVFTAQYKSACCPRRCYGSSSVSFIEDVLDVAVDAALLYTGVTAAAQVADVAGDVLGSIFDW